MRRIASVKVELQDRQEGTRETGRRESCISFLKDRSGKLPENEAALCSAICALNNELGIRVYFANTQTIFSASATATSW